MPTIKKAANERSYGAIVSSKVRSHANDPYVVKKAAEAKEALSKISISGSKEK